MDGVGALVMRAGEEKTCGHRRRGDARTHAHTRTRLHIRPHTHPTRTYGAIIQGDMVGGVISQEARSTQTVEATGANVSSLFPPSVPLPCLVTSLL